MKSDAATPMSPDRRHFLSAASPASLGTVSSGAGLPAVSTPSPAQQGDLPEPRTGVTRALARYLVSARAADVPAAVCKEAHRTLLNWVGCAVASTRCEPRTSSASTSTCIPSSSAGMRDFSDANAKDPVIVALRDRVTATVDKTIQEHQVRPRDPQARALLDLCWKVDTLPSAAARAEAVTVRVAVRCPCGSGPQQP